MSLKYSIDFNNTDIDTSTRSSSWSYVWWLIYSNYRIEIMGKRYFIFESQLIRLFPWRNMHSSSAVAELRIPAVYIIFFYVLVDRSCDWALIKGLRGKRSRKYMLKDFRERQEEEDRRTCRLCHCHWPYLSCPGKEDWET